METLYLIDGNSLLYRAFYAIPPFTTKAGFQTNAVFGFAKMLLKLIKDRHPTHLAVVMDAKGPTFRDAQFEKYKAQRPKAPDELNAQRPFVRRFVEAMDIPLLEVSGVEADDVIGTLVRRYESPNREIYIVTGDKDLMQFVHDGRVMLYDTMKNVVYDEKAVKEKMGVGPECIIDLLALMGDTADNIPGVKGIGPKTAVKLLTDHGSFRSIMDGAEGIAGSVGEKLRADREMAELSFQLSTIKTDVEVDTSLDSLAITQPDIPALEALFVELEFKSLMREVNGAMEANGKGRPQVDEPSATAPVPSDLPAFTTVPVTDMAAMERLWNNVRKANRFAYLFTRNAETNPMRVRVEGLSVSTGDGNEYVIDFSSDKIDKAAVLTELKTLMFDEAITAIGHDIKLDLHAIENELGPKSHGIPMVQPSLL